MAKKMKTSIETYMFIQHCGIIKHVLGVMKNNLDQFPKETKAASIMFQIEEIKGMLDELQLLTVSKEEG